MPWPTIFFGGCDSTSQPVLLGKGLYSRHWKARKNVVLRCVRKCFASFCFFNGLQDDGLFKCPVTKTIFKDAALVDPLLGVLEEVF